MSSAVLAAVIGSGGGIAAALIGVVVPLLRRVEEKIDGLRNGTYHQAMAAIAELQREKEELRVRGLTGRRVVDRMIPEDGK
jgi:hypothetical protein